MIDPRAQRYRAVARKLFVLLRTGECRPTSGAEVDLALAECMREITSCLEHEPHLLLQERSGYLFGNGVRIPRELDGWEAVEGLVSYLHSRGHAGLMFERGVRSDELLALVGVLSGDQPLDTHLARACLERVQVLESAGPEAAPAPAATFLQSVYVAQNLVAWVDPARFPDLPEAKRILTAVAEALLDDRTALDAFSELAAAPDRARAAVNDCVVAVKAGVDLGLTEPLLRELAFAALFRRLGFLRLVGLWQRSPCFERALLCAADGPATDDLGPGLVAALLDWVDAGSARSGMGSQAELVRELELRLAPN